MTTIDTTTTTVTAHNATFTKKSGESRTMNFVKISQLPESFVNTQISGTGTARTLAEGQELVWDLDNNGFRIFNWNTVVGEVTSNEVSFETSFNNTTDTVVQ